ncbi:MAG: DUF4340 domain-containing protein [Verrucomicrobia bacterium]|nr:DUF4340 domain-containing protein [Verrucomicrobiota bacterium]
MKPKTTLILLVIASAMGLFIWLKDSQLPSTADRESRAKRVFDLKGDDITKIQVALNTSNLVGRIVIEKEKDRWQLREPLAYRASGSEMNSICSALEFLNRDGIITPAELKTKGSKLSDYGLDKPPVELTFWKKDQQTVIKVGKASAVGSTVYIQLAGKDDILMVDKSLLAKLDRKVDELRDKTVAEFSTLQANRFEIVQGKKSIEVVKASKPGAAASPADKIWRIAQPIVVRADQGKVDGLLDKLHGLQAESFATDKAVDLTTYGLDQPQLELTVYTTEHEGAITVQFGGAVKDDATKVYCRRKGSDTVLTVRSDALKDFNVPVNDMRDKKLADLNADDARQIAISFASQPIRLAKEKDDWKLTEPETIQAENGEVSNLLTNLTGLEVKEFVADVVTDLAKYGLDRPYYTLTVKKDAPPPPATPATTPVASTNAPAVSAATNVVAAANKAAAGVAAAKSELVTAIELQFGKEDKEKKIIYVKRADEPYIYAVESSTFEKLPKTALALRNRTLIATEKSKVTKLTRQHGTVAITIEKKDDKWKLAPGVQGVLDTNVVDDVLWAITGLNAEKFLSVSAADRAKFGLDKPAWTLSFDVNESGTNKTFSLSLGYKTTDKGSYGALAGQPAIFELSAATTGSLTKDLLKRPETNLPPAKVTAPATKAVPGK